MKCPFELPVEANVSVVDSDRRYITGTNGFPFICGDADKEAADYIVQAINSYKKFKTALEVISDHEDHRKNAGVGYDGVVDEYAKQALKEIK